MTEALHFSEIDSVVSEIRHLSSWLEVQAGLRGVPPEVHAKLDLCMNEAVANAITHGESTGPIRIELNVSQRDGRGDAVLSIYDHGKEFDLVNAPLRERPTTLADAVPGGLGLIMIRSNADVLQWSRDGGVNKLDLTVKWSNTSDGK